MHLTQFKQFLLVLVFQVFFIAQTGPCLADADTPPHSDRDKTLGLIHGFIFTKNPDGEQIPIPQHPMQLTVFQGEQVVLVLPKVSGTDGQFVIKNIFRDPSFQYSLGTEYQGRTYLIPHIGLNADQESIAINFQVGSDSPYEVQALPVKNIRQKDTQGQRIATGTDDWQRPFKTVTVILVLVTLGLAAYHSTRKRS